VTLCENLRLLASRAELIDETEATLAMLRPWVRSYALRWHPKFVYILRLDQSSKERVPPGRLWVSAKESEAASGGLCTQPEAGGDGDVHSRDAEASQEVLLVCKE
jgi:hypothetical protein